MNAKSATCTEKGYTGDTKCTDCENIVAYGEEIDASGHLDLKTVLDVKPTCDTDGYTGDTYCADCNNTVKTGSVIPAKGHEKTKIIGVVNATCIEQGYTGDKVCTVCNDTIEKGKFTPTIAHNVQLVGRVEPTTTSDGYSGDMICINCGFVSERGTILPKIEDDNQLKEVIRTEDGRDYHFWIPVDGDGFDYTIEKCDKRYTSPYDTIEERILYLVNIERAKVGVAPLTMEKRAAYFTHIRGVECIETFSHKRPDGRRWTTVYYDEGVYIGCAGENLAKTYGLYEVYGEDYDVAAHFVNMWMKSDSHREAMLNPGYKSISISVTIENNVFVGVQHFFGFKA